MRYLLMATIAAIALTGCGSAPKKQTRTTIQEVNHAVWSEVFHGTKAAREWKMK